MFSHWVRMLRMLLTSQMQALMQSFPSPCKTEACLAPRSMFCHSGIISTEEVPLEKSKENSRGLAHFNTVLENGWSEKIGPRNTIHPAASPKWTSERCECFKAHLHKELIWQEIRVSVVKSFYDALFRFQFHSNSKVRKRSCGKILPPSYVHFLLLFTVVISQICHCFGISFSLKRSASQNHSCQ